jgi:8-oxo-dGTP pyrophosphatase MutT (NUDIX family)
MTSELFNALYIMKMLTDAFFANKTHLARGVSLYIENGQGKFLFQLRTPKARRERNKWCPPSGGMKPFETPRQTLKREMREELGVDFKHCHFVRDYLWYSKESSGLWYNHNFVFWVKTDLPLESFERNEGRDLQYLSAKKLLDMNLAFNHNATLRDILAWRHQIKKR